MLPNNRYQRFDNTQSVENGQPCPQVVIGQQQCLPSNALVMTMIKASQQRPLLSGRKIKILAVVELLQSMLMILFESILIISMSVRGDYNRCSMCGYGNGVWAGTFGVIAASLGVAGVRGLNGKRCPLVAHLVLSIISTIMDGVVIIMTSICILISRGSCYYGYYEFNIKESERRKRLNYVQESVDIITGLETFILLLAVTHFVFTIVSSALLCRNICRTEPTQIIFTYTPQPTTPNFVGQPVQDIQFCAAQVPFLINNEHQAGPQQPNLST